MSSEIISSSQKYDQSFFMLDKLHGVSDVINKRIDQLTDELMNYIRQNYSLMMIQSDIASLDVRYQI
jgi:hypothetical protein